MPKFSDIIYYPFQIKTLREKVIFYLKQHFYQDFHFSMPIGKGLNAPCCFADSYDSFSEIFLTDEYDFVLSCWKLPDRWLDLGCNNGYFSLWLERERRKAHKEEGKAYLLDADQKSSYSVQKLIQENNLTGFHYQEGAVGGSKEYVEFFERPFMSSSSFAGDYTQKRKVKVVQEKELMKVFSPPYDLIKVDIEGSEWDFLNNYPNILKNTHYMLVEWHSWHAGGRGRSQVKQRLEELQFNVLKETTEIQVDKEGRTVGLFFAEKNL